MGPLGWQETIFIFVLALLIFGPKKLPELGKTIGKAMTEFRRASSELKSTWDREMASLEREKESLNEVARSYENEIDKSVNDGTTYDSNSYYDSGYEYGYGAEPSATSTDSSTVSAAETSSAELTATEQAVATADHNAVPAASADIADAAADSLPPPAAAGESKPVQA